MSAVLSCPVSSVVRLSSQAGQRKQQPSCSPGLLLISPTSSTTRRHARLARLPALGNSKDNKTITREDEPEEYWQTAAERKGESPFKDPLAIIGLLAIFAPFLLLGIAIALGYVDVNAGRP